MRLAQWLISVVSVAWEWSLEVNNWGITFLMMNLNAGKKIRHSHSISLLSNSGISAMKKIDGGKNTTHYFIYQHSRDHSNEYKKHLIPALLQFAAFCFKNYPCLSIGIDLVDSSTHGSKIFWLVKKNIPSLKLTATLPLIVFWQKDFQAFPFGFRPHFFCFYFCC